MKARVTLALVVALGLSACGGGHHSTVTTTTHPSTGQIKYHTALGESAHSPTFGVPPKGFQLPSPAIGVPTLEMYDTVTLSTVPANPVALAGYTSGFWPTYLPLVHAYPHAVVKSIAVSVLHNAMCLDIEPGDATPSEAAAWYKTDVAAGFRKPCYYANLSTMPAVQANLAANHIPRSAVFLWDADWTYHQHLDSGYDATQWTDRSGGKNLDESTATLAFLGKTPPKPPPPAKTYCFGKHYDPKHSAKVCTTVRPLTSRRSHARDASKRVYALYHCKSPERRPVCRTMRHRITYFNEKVQQAIHQYG